VLMLYGVARGAGEPLRAKVRAAGSVHTVYQYSSNEEKKRTLRSTANRVACYGHVHTSA
jgi:hypothetical protein